MKYDVKVQLAQKDSDIAIEALRLSSTEGVKRMMGIAEILQGVPNIRLVDNIVEGLHPIKGKKYIRVADTTIGGGGHLIVYGRLSHLVEEDTEPKYDEDGLFFGSSPEILPSADDDAGVPEKEVYNEKKGCNEVVWGEQLSFSDYDDAVISKPFSDKAISTGEKEHTTSNPFSDSASIPNPFMDMPHSYTKRPFTRPMMWRKPHCKFYYFMRSLLRLVGLFALSVGILMLLCYSITNVGNYTNTLLTSVYNALLP